MILGQVADDRAKKEMVKISVVVDSGAEANALPGKPSSASKSGRVFRGAEGDPIPPRGERSVTGRTDGTKPKDRVGSLPSEAFSLERCQDQRAQRVDAGLAGKETS